MKKKYILCKFLNFTVLFIFNFFLLQINLLQGQEDLQKETDCSTCSRCLLKLKSISPSEKHGELDDLIRKAQEREKHEEWDRLIREAQIHCAQLDCPGERRIVPGNKPQTLREVADTRWIEEKSEGSSLERFGNFLSELFSDKEYKSLVALPRIVAKAQEEINYPKKHVLALLNYSKSGLSENDRILIERNPTGPTITRLSDERWRSLSSQERSSIPVVKKTASSSSSSSKPATRFSTRFSTPFFSGPQPLGSSIPDIARGYENIYLRFIKGKLVYKPDPKSDKGRIDLLISALSNPLEGTFDLSQCGDTGKYLSISTGYRKGKNANKIEIWFTPRFLIERNIVGSASYFQPIMDQWDEKIAPVGIFWTWGGEDKIDRYSYLISESMSALGSQNLFEKRQQDRTKHTHFGTVLAEELERAFMLRFEPK